VEVPDRLYEYRNVAHKEGVKMVKSSWLAVPGALMLCLGTVWVSNAQAPAQGPSYAIYCRGQLETLRTEAGKVIKTPFKWAKEVAVKENPGAGECAWAERAPAGIDSKPGDRATIVGNLGPFDSIPVGTIGKICVMKASNPNELNARQVVRHLGHSTSPFHLPPFSAEGCPG
jgi:hypothetical protein